MHSLAASAVALLILIVFLFSGEGILRVFSVDIRSFAVAGSLVIFLFAIEMILDVEIYRNHGPTCSSAFVPLAFPLIAGPGSFTTLLSLRAEYSTETCPCKRYDVEYRAVRVACDDDCNYSNHK